MAWQPIPNNEEWEYDDAATNHGGVAGIRTRTLEDGVSQHQVYVKCRLVGSTDENNGEISKTYWDAHP